jgi:hypothetical protein
MASVNAGQAPSVISRLALMVVAVIVSRCSGIGFVDQASLQISITATKTKGRRVLRSPASPDSPPPELWAFWDSSSALHCTLVRKSSVEGFQKKNMDYLSFEV